LPAVAMMPAISGRMVSSSASNTQPSEAQDEQHATHDAGRNLQH
jgi:hypothetical protein